MGIAALGGIGLSLVVVLAAPSLHASPSARLVYARTADVEGCPSEMELRLGVVHRLGYDPFEYGARRTVVALIERDEDALAGSVEVISEEGVSEGRRRFESPSDRCTELVRAMALSVSLALDAKRAREAGDRTLDDESPQRAERARESSRELLRASRSSLREDRGVLQDDADRLRFGVGTGAQLTLGTAPVMAPGLSLVATTRYDFFRLDVELRIDRDVSAALPRVGPSARLETSVVAASAVRCLTLGVAFGCGVASLGSLAARASGITLPARDSGLYSAAGARLGVSVPVSPSVSLELLGDGVVQPLRPEVAVGDEVVWRQPLMAAGLGARVVGTIP